MVAEMESRGIPIDTEALELLRARWEELRAVVAEVDNTYGIYDGLSFRQARFAACSSR